MMYRKRILGLSASVLLTTTAAHAGNLSSSSWTPAGCGTEPTLQKLNLSNIDAYNASLPQVEKFQDSNRKYIDCLVTEANADVQRISQAAKSAQQAVIDRQNKIVADVQAAGKTLDEEEEKAAAAGR